jgi:hypothetical protein
MLDVPIEVLQKIDSLRRVFLCTVCDKVTSGMCKIGWETVYKPKYYGGLGVLNLGNFGLALRMRWLWHEWNDKEKPWIGLRILLLYF